MARVVAFALLLFAAVVPAVAQPVAPNCKRRSNNPSLKRPGIPVAPE